MNDDDKRIEARWVVDSETGERYLVDLPTGKIIAKLDADGVITDVSKGGK